MQVERRARGGRAETEEEVRGLGGAGGALDNDGVPEGEGEGDTSAFPHINFVISLGRALWEASIASARSDPYEGDDSVFVSPSSSEADTPHASGG
jgi:hypothetical protein